MLDNATARRPNTSERRQTLPSLLRFNIDVLMAKSARKKRPAAAPEEPLEAEPSEVEAVESQPSAAATNGHAPSRRRRATAQSMAASQRDISVSEFFAKNRHLLGFDNPRKALLTTIKEAVDNSLDACEEAGILPEIWVHVAADRPQSLQGRRAGQRPGHSQEADSADLRQAAVRLEVSPPADEPRPARHRHQRGRHVRRADHRQAGEDHLQGLAAQAGPLLRNQDRHQAQSAGDPQRPGRGRRHSARRGRHRLTSRSTASSGSSSITARA